MLASVRLALPATRPIGGALGMGGLVAAVTFLLPGPWLAVVARALSFPATLHPSVEMAFRTAVALGCGGLVAGAIWAALRVVRRRPQAIPSDAGVPALRRADAHPDAPARRPLSAAELTVPVFDPDARAVPEDLATPLSALDPAAIPTPPGTPVRAAATLAPGERLQTFRLAPPPARQPVASEAPGIDALLRRLEDGTGRRRPA